MNKPATRICKPRLLNCHETFEATVLLDCHDTDAPGSHQQVKIALGRIWLQTTLHGCALWKEPPQRRHHCGFWSPSIARQGCPETTRRAPLRKEEPTSVCDRRMCPTRARRSSSLSLARRYNNLFSLSHLPLVFHVSGQASRLPSVLYVAYRFCDTSVDSSHVYSWRNRQARFAIQPLTRRQTSSSLPFRSARL